MNVKKGAKIMPIIFLIIGSFISGVAAETSVATETLVVVEPPTGIFKLNQTFNLNLTIAPQMGVTITAAQMNVGYNPKIFRVDSISEGPFLKGPEGIFSTYWCCYSYEIFPNTGVINNTGGSVSNIFSSVIGNHSVSQRNAMIKMNLTVISLPASVNLSKSENFSIDLTNVKIAKREGEENGLVEPFIIQNGSLPVRTAPVLAGLSVFPAKTTIPVGGTIVPVVAHKDQHGVPMLCPGCSNCSSSNTTILQVNKTTCKATGKMPGQAKIVAKNGSIIGSANYTVEIRRLATVNVSPNNSAINISSSRIFKAAGKDQFAKPFTGVLYLWNSTNTTVVEVNASTGNATAKNSGSAKICATNQTVAGCALVTVVDPTAGVNLAEEVKKFLLSWYFIPTFFWVIFIFLKRKFY